jgi:hypothetical protein
MCRSFKILIAIAYILFIVSCKKYQDGPEFSFRSVAKRLERKWKLDRIEQNGQVVTFPYNPQYQDYEYTKDGKFILRALNAYQAIPMYQEGTWQFIDNKMKIFTSIYAYNDTMDIHRLTSKELWLFDGTNSPGLRALYKFKAE